MLYCCIVAVRQELDYKNGNIIRISQLDDVYVNDDQFEATTIVIMVRQLI